MEGVGMHFPLHKGIKKKEYVLYWQINNIDSMQAFQEGGSRELLLLLLVMIAIRSSMANEPPVLGHFP